MGILSIGAWGAAYGFIYFMIAKKLNLLRYHWSIEIIGTDMTELGEIKEKFFIKVEQWYEINHKNEIKRRELDA